MNKQQLMQALESDIKEIEIKAINAAVRIKVLTGRARDAFYTLIQDGDKSNSYFESAITAATLVDENGAPMFETADIEALREKNATAVSQIAAAAMKVNVIGQAAEAEAAKN